MIRQQHDTVPIRPRVGQREGRRFLNLRWEQPLAGAQAAALSLHAAGLTVYATARQVDTLAELAVHGLHTLALDVTDEASMTDAVAAVEQEAGPVGVLVNNAGYGLYGPVEQLPMDEIRRQFETNFLGLVRLPARACDSVLRRQYGLPR